MNSYLTAAYQALAMDRKGKSVPEIKAKLGVQCASEVHRMILSAKCDERCRGYAITPDELTVIRNVGRSELRGFAAGETCAPKLKYCGGWFWPRSKAQRIAKGRISYSLRLVDVWHGGYARLTLAGWTLFHAIDGGSAQQ